MPLPARQGPTGLTSRSNRSDRSRRSPSQLRFLCRFRSVIRDSLRDKSTPPYKYKGSRPIEIQLNRTNQIHLSLSFLPFFLPTFPMSTCYSSLVSMEFEDTLAGLPSLGQPYARLPRRGPSRVSVRRIVVVLHGDRSDRSR